MRSIIKCSNSYLQMHFAIHYIYSFTDRVLLSPSIDDSSFPFHLMCTPFFFFQFLTLFRFLHSQWSWGSLLWNQAVLLLVCKASLIDSTVTSWEKSINWVCRSKCKIGNIIQNKYKYKLTQYLYLYINVIFKWCM